MSVAEKLKVLEGKLCVDEGYHEYVAFSALPQIVAVVEAAQEVSYHDRFPQSRVCGTPSLLSKRRCRERSSPLV